MSDEATDPLVDADRAALGRRLLAQIGISDGALFVGRTSVLTLVAAAVRHGANITTAEACEERHCRVCGCSEFNACRPEPCAWAAEDLCTACAPFVGAGG